jgi:hypothetical protein
LEFPSLYIALTKTSGFVRRFFLYSLPVFRSQQIPFLVLFSNLILVCKIDLQNQKEACDMNTDKILAEAIAKEYAPKDNSKIIALKKLDNQAKLPATIFTYTFGIVSALVFGTGMCLAMGVIGSGMAGMVLGIIIGMIGMIGCGMNYPIYKRMLEKGKAKYAFEIVQLAREIADM